MKINLDQELQRFQNLKKNLSLHFKVQELGPYIYKILPLLPSPANAPKKKRIGILGLVHGNEILGLPVINQVLEDLLQGKISIDSEIYVALGNVPAANANLRYIESDLNRSFGSTSVASSEDRRARQLEKLMLDHCDILIDLHQTIVPSKAPFFIFQYSSDRCLAIIKEINPGLPTILQFESISQISSLASDEYVRMRGGFGTTIELGQIGFHQEYFDLGLAICKQALEALPNLGATSSLSTIDFPLFRLLSPYLVNRSGSYLFAGWENLREFKKGDLMGMSEEGPIHAPHSGLMMFPKYTPPIRQGLELFYTCSPVALSEITLSGTLTPAISK